MAEALRLALLLAAALNPVRLRGAAVAEDEPGRAGRPSLAGVGTATVAFGALVVAVALGADGIADALALSPPTVHLAAGIVATLQGAFELLARPPRVHAPAGGWAAGLSPVAFPLLARPAVVLLALSGGLERPGVTIGVGLAAGAVTGASALWSLPAAGRGATVWRAGGRLLAAVLVLLAVDLGVDGALAA